MIYDLLQNYKPIRLIKVKNYNFRSLTSNIKNLHLIVLFYFLVSLPINSSSVIDRSTLGVESGQILIYRVTHLFEDIEQNSIQNSHNLIFLNAIKPKPEIWFSLHNVNNDSLRIISQLSFYYQNNSVVEVGFGIQSLKEIGSLVVYPDWSYLKDNFFQSFLKNNYTHQDNLFSYQYTNFTFEIQDDLVNISYLENLTRYQQGASIKTELTIKKILYDFNTGVLRSFYQKVSFHVLNDPHIYSYSFQYEFNRLNYFKIITSSEGLQTNTPQLSTQNKLMSGVINIYFLILLTYILTNKKNGKVSTHY